MPELDPVLRLSAILVLGVGAQWLAWRLRLPSILLLLCCGLLAGPGAEAALGFNLLQPDRVLGELLRPFTSLAVGLILFEGGMTLRLRELSDVGAALRGLLTVGALLTWLGIAGCAFGLGLLNGELSLLLGAILVVTGPTVIGPILRQVRPRGRVGPLLKWEGIVIDPIGAVLAVMVFEAIISTTGGSGVVHGLLGFLKASLVGGSLGGLAAGALILLIQRHLTPERLESPLALALLAACFSGSNALQEESGLIAATVMGFLVGHVLEEEARPIAEFKETLQVLLIGLLFVVLSSRLEVEHVAAVLDWRVAAFLVALILVVRPAAVFASTLHAPLSTRERLFLSWMAPRGIVAAAVASVFALRLTDAGHAEAVALAPLTFLVIIATVALYGLTAGPLARRLGLAVAQPQGVLFLGAHDWARQLARALQDEDVQVLLLDNNFKHVSAARMEGLPAVHAHVRSQFVAQDLELGGIGHFVALTSNDEINALAADAFANVLGRANVYELQSSAAGSHRHVPVPSARTRQVFSGEVGHERLTKLAKAGYGTRATPLTSEFDLDDWRAQHGEEALPLFLIAADGAVAFFATDRKPSPARGDTLIGFVAPTEERGT